MKKENCAVSKKPFNWHGELGNIFLHLPDTKHKISMYRDHDNLTKRARYHIVFTPKNGIGKKELASIDKNLSQHLEKVCDVCHNEPTTKNPTSYKLTLSWV